jgi:hypothetical protein
MTIVTILQYIDGTWIHLGDIRGRSYNVECKKMDDLQDALNFSTDNIITIRQDTSSMLIINLNHGPVRLSVKD